MPKAKKGKTKETERKQATVALTERTDILLEKVVSNFGCSKEAFVNVLLQSTLLDNKKTESLIGLLELLGVKNKGVANLQKEGL